MKESATASSAGTKRGALKSRSAKVKAVWPPSSGRNREELLGLSEMRREGGAIIRDVALGRRSVAFSTNTKQRQIRWRAVAEYQDEVANVPDENKIQYSELTANSAQIRVVVWMGAKLVIRSGRYAVIMDRHPDCPSDVVETELKRIRAKARSGAMKRLANDMREIREMMELRGKRDAEVKKALEQLAGQATLAESDRKLLKSLAARLIPDIIVANKRLPNSADLERTLMD